MRILRRTLAQAIRATMLLVLLILPGVGGCAPLITGTNDPAKVKEIMQSTNARGCIYARASATPWAQATTIIVGTWGTDGPKFSECWQGLPAGVP